MACFIYLRIGAHREHTLISLKLGVPFRNQTLNCFLYVPDRVMLKLFIQMLLPCDTSVLTG